MRLSYNRLWKLLIDKGMNKRSLSEQANISNTTVAKLGKGENVNTDVLLKILRFHIGNSIIKLEILDYLD